MATKTLRPVSDGSVEHSKSSGSNAYSLISEATQDGDSTYIYQTLSSTSSRSVSSTVTLGALFDSVNYTVTACRLCFYAKRTASNTSSASVTFKVDDSGNYAASASSLGTSYTVYSANSEAMVEAINAALRSGRVPSITATITTTGNMSSSKDSSSQIRITQVYLELDYDSYAAPTTGIFIKENGSWKKYSKVFKKVNGSWVEQTNIAGLFSTSANYVKGN